MTDAEFLLLLVAGVYLSECARWVRPEMIVFWTPLGTRWRAAWSGRLIGNQQGGLKFCNPLPPLGQIFVCRAWPISLSPEGVLGYVAQAVGQRERPPQSGLYFRWDEVRSAKVDGRSLLVNGRLLATVGSRQLAAELAKLLRSLSKARPERRARIIERSLRSSFDVEALRSVWKQFRRNSWGLRMLCNLLVLFVFINGPLLIWLPNYWQRWLSLLATLLLMVVGVNLEYFLLHRHYFREARGERWKHLALMAFSPMAAMRAHDTLSYDLLAEFHPLTVAQVLLPPRRFAEFAGPILRDLRHPLPSPDAELDAQSRSVAAWHRQLLDRSIASLLEAASLSEVELLAPPEREGEDCLAYCPRCHGQYAIASGECTACAGLTLVPWAT
jgi:hypothetical protein